MHWVYLVLAIVFEVTATSFMKASQGLTRWQPTVAMLVFYIVSFSLLSLAAKAISISVVYAIWSGLGTALITIVGAVYFGEPGSLMKYVWIGVITAGVVGLNLCGGGHGQ